MKLSITLNAGLMLALVLLLHGYGMAIGQIEYLKTHPIIETVAIPAEEVNISAFDVKEADSYCRGDFMARKLNGGVYYENNIRKGGGA